MEVLTPFAWVVYGIIAVVALFFRGTVKVNDILVRNPLARVLVTMLVLSFVGVVFYAIGFVGHFLLLPIFSMF